MSKLFADIKILLWDFDGTFYKPNPDLWKAVRDAEIRVITDHTGWSRERAEEIFYKVYKVVYHSATETTAELSKITTPQAAREMENYYDRRPYLTRDENLIQLFQDLSSYSHYILANGYREKLVQCLDVLGVPVNTFQEIVTSELVGKNKPNPEGFEYILKKTGFAPSAHLMIGDRESVDLAPARALGIKTCLVFSETQGQVADVTVPTVYDVKKVLL